ncbi:hypothetical protein VOLCADRAFT_105083 [Volvox carteri f. nagariensis]|uniref:Uncharacterized protein n=1 Tax=Volvox carteri f. nagariensis TaxID=3068 RepID=D8TYB4_VOLCA|nr:uncharacterized protein VOLCADRAFT_105083 [Volvox carteri f. nagariensis]EFJ47612.1 hypothetical protein VOLCADRAFT_105083 [Volvox carteri f. nagariensis]|eukprot:XP_002951436.1 hypothetical protein VOLCADRAFT_105083 [Volvox carteri f. nagariensis]
MGCATSCLATSAAEIKKSIRYGDERAIVLKLAEQPKLLSAPCFPQAATPLHQACKARSTKVVQAIIGFLLNASLETVRTALVPYCCREGKHSPITVSDGVRMAVNMVNTNGQTPLMYACSVDCPELVELLLAYAQLRKVQGTSWCVNRPVGHTTTTILYGIVRVLPHAAGYVDARSCCGLTVLHYSVYYGCMESLRELLLHHEPHLNALTTAECGGDLPLACEARSSPLHVAAVVGSLSAAQELLLHYVRQVCSGRRVVDPRAIANAAGQLPWQVAISNRPSSASLAALLHPRQPLAQALGIDLSRYDMASSVLGGGSGSGPPPLAVIAAAATRRKLLADLHVQRQAAAAAAAAAAPGAEAEAGLIKGNTFGATAFASYGAFWMGWFLLELLMKQYPSVYKTALTGKTLWCGLWAFLTAGFFVVTLRKNGCLMTIFSTLVITFSLLAGGVWNESCELAAGYFGFFCGASAIYAAFAFLFKIELGIVLPGARPVNYLPADSTSIPGHEHHHHLGAVVLPIPGNGGGRVLLVVDSNSPRGNDGGSCESGQQEGGSKAKDAPEGQRTENAAS